MREPKMPGNTCPRIDKIQEILEDSAGTLQGLVADIEELREANAQLRDCAEYWEEKANYLCKEVDRLEGIIND